MAKLTGLVLNSFDNTATMTVSFRLSAPFRFKLWVGIKLIRLAGFIMGIGIKVDDIDAITEDEKE